MNKRLSITKLMLVLTFFLSVICLIGCNEKPELSFETVSVEVEAGKTFTLNPTIKNLHDGVVEYAFDKEGIVELKNGNEFLAKEKGTVVITASLKGNKDIKVEITVTVKAKQGDDPKPTEPKLVTEIKLTVKETLEIGEETELTYEVLPQDADSKEVEVSNSNNEVISLENNKIKALKAGTSVITVTAKDDSKVKAEVTITVNEPSEPEPKLVTVAEAIAAKEGLLKVEGVVVGLSNASYIIKDETGMMIVYKGYSWTPDVKLGDKVAVSGNVSVYGKAVQFGQDSTSEVLGTSSVELGSPKVLSGFELTELAESESMEVTYVKLVGTLNISGNYVNLTIDGTSVVGSLALTSASKESIAELNGKVIEVTGFGAYFSGNNKYYNVVVSSFESKGFEIVGQTEMEVGDDIDLQVTGATDKVTWECSDPTICEVVDGTVTALKKGTVTITAKCGENEATIEITVKGKIFKVKFVAKDGKTVLSEQEVEQGDAAVAPEVPELEGYLFVKWSTSYDNVQRNLTIKPIYGVKHNITYELDGGVLPEDAKFEYAEGYQYILPTPSKKGYLFVGWTESPTSSSYMTRISNKSKTDVTLYAKYIVKNYYDVTFDFNGGLSSELYLQNGTPIATIDCNNYNYNDGSFWGGEYPNCVFFGDSSHDPTATFSDRIYIGKDSYTGLYKIINILNSGTSYWPEGADYVITISTSYAYYRTEHNKILKLSVGDIIAFSKDITTSGKNSPTQMHFYKPEIEAKLYKGRVEADTNLIIPGRLGFEFLGWFDANGKKYDSFADFDDDVTIIAKWNELVPVTDVVVEGMVTEMLTTDVIQLKAHVLPTDAFFQDITFSSSDSDIISVSSTGKLVAINAGTATITVVDYAKKVTKTFEITVYPVTSTDVTFSEGYNGFLKVGEEVTIKPVAYGKGVNDVKYEFSVDKMDIVSVDANGKVTALKNGSAVVTIKDTTGKVAPLTITVVVDALSEADKVEKVMTLLMKNNFSVVQTGNACLYNDGTNRYYDAVYGSVNNYLFDSFDIIRDYESKAEANPNCHRSRRPTDQIEFVTVHDTATLTGTVESIASYMSSGETSIHYTVGNDKIYSVVPEKYIAYHAGDGTGVPFQWIPSGVKALSNTKPDIDLTQSGGKYYFTVNGQMSNVEAPISDGSKTIVNPSRKNLPETGPVWKVVNGEYYLGTSWVCFSQNISGIISNHGGNNNSIGIEMNVNTSNDTYDSWQRTARLVADILIRNNLDLTRVMMHNNWSGKGCPQVFLSGNYWSYFMKMVELNYILQKDYSDVQISMVSNDPDIVDNTGRVMNPPVETKTVSYNITVKSGSNSKTVTLYSVIPGTTTWEQWNGTYASSKVWNNGNFVR